MDHTTASTPSAQHSEDSHDEHGQAPTADPVRGLTVAQDGYQLGALTAPAAVGENGTLSFRLTGPDWKPVTDYTTAHDKDLHLIVVEATAAASATSTRASTLPRPGRCRGGGPPLAATGCSPTSSPPPPGTR